MQISYLIIVQHMNFYKDAKILAKKKGNNVFQFVRLFRRILLSYFDDKKSLDLIPSVLKEYEKFVYDDYENIWLKYFQLRYEAYVLRKNNVLAFIEVEKKIETNKYPFLKAKYQHYIGVLFYYYERDFKASDSYYKKAFKNFNATEYFYPKSYSLGVYTKFGS